MKPKMRAETLERLHTLDADPEWGRKHE